MNCRKCPESILVLKDGKPAEMVMDPNSETCKSCMDELIMDTIERHKETLDMLAKDDGPVFKPCPFCGSRLLSTFHYGHRRDLPWIAECFGCFAEGPWAKTEKEAIELWNRRVNE